MSASEARSNSRFVVFGSMVFENLCDGITITVLKATDSILHSNIRVIKTIRDHEVDRRTDFEVLLVGVEVLGHVRIIRHSDLLFQANVNLVQNEH